MIHSKNKSTKLFIGLLAAVLTLCIFCVMLISNGKSNVGVAYAESTAVETTDTATVSTTTEQTEIDYSTMFQWSVDSNNNVMITKYIGTDTEVVIPSEIDGYPVTSIGSNAFRDCSVIVSVKIPESVTSIGEYAFYYCTGLTNIVLPESITSIGKVAFCNCRSLTNINIPKKITVIENMVFKSCIKLKEIDILESVTSIGEEAFHNCSSLTSIKIPEGVTSIGWDAFRYCSSLTGVYITSLESWCNINIVNIYEGILYYAQNLYLNDELVTKLTVPKEIIEVKNFAYCKALVEVNIADGVATIGSSAFDGCSNLASISIPESVTSIGDNAFNNCSSLSSITLPESITSIEGRAFYGCSSLTSIEIPEGVTSIGSSAFYNCNSLTIINIPDSVTSIGASAFYNCSSLTSITIPENVVSLGEVKYVTPIKGEVFYNCKNLEEVIFSGESQLTNIIEKTFYGCEKLKLIEIPNGVTSIGNSVFYNCSSLTSIKIPEGVNSIGGSAFRNCSSLTSINIPKDVTSIGSYTFSRCISLTSINIPEGVTSIGSYAFQSCKSLTSIKIPERVTSIGNEAFSGCDSLTNITIPKGVTSIGNYTFIGCISLTSINIPESVTSIGNNAFYNCANLKTVYINNAELASNVTSYSSQGYLFSANSSYGARQEIAIIGENPTVGSYITANYPYTKTITEDGVLYTVYSTTEFKPTFVETWDISATSADSVTAYLYNHAEEGYYTLSIEGTGNMLDWASSSSVSWASYKANIKEVIVGEGVTNIGNYAFYGCSSLTSINISKSVTSIGKLAFQSCSSLTSINIPKCVTSIGNGSFYNCSSLTSITIPESVTSIGESAFQSCSSLTSINIPEGVTNIGWSAFDGCSSLTSINIPESVTSIGNRAFYNCSSLASITIPENVISIGKSAFYNCSSLASINIPENVTSIGESAFYKCSSLKGIYITSIESWGNIAFVNNYANPLYYAKNLYVNGELISGDITIAEGVTSIGMYAFYYCSDITSVTLPEGITSIGNYAFYRCINLTSINIPESVTSIGNYAFYNCSSLTSINILNGVTSIGNYAFQYCSSLASINIPEGVTNIGHYTFFGCRSLTSINIPEGVTIIGNGVFYNCSSLISIKIPEGVTIIGYEAFRDCSSLTSINIPESVTSIKDLAFRDCSSLTSIYIPGNLTSIGSSAFYGCTNLKTVYINNADLASDVTSYSSQGDLFSANSSYGARLSIAIIGENPTVGSYITANFTNVSELKCVNGDGDVAVYNVYSKHSHADDSEFWVSTDNESVFNCSQCGISKYFDHSHQWGDWVVMTAPNETESGLAKRVCLLDGTHEDLFEIPALSSGAFVYTAPTCTVDGGYYFEDLEKNFVYEVKESATGHSYGEWEVVTPPTCEEMGQGRKDCLNCSHFETRDVQAKGHTEEILAAVEPNCYQTGLTEGKWCSVCEKIIVEQQILPIAHNFKEIEKINATCVDDGYTLMRCDCGAEEKWDIVYALEHNMSSWVTIENATCEAHGKEKSSCLNENCDYGEIRHTDKLAHDYIALGGGIFICQNGCGDRYEVSTGGAIESEKQKPIYDCPENFQFTVYYIGSKSDVEQSVTITQDFNYGSGNDIEFIVEQGENANEWKIVPVKKYKQGATYIATLSNGVTLCGQYLNTTLKGDNLEFTIEIIENKADIEFNEKVKFLPFSDIIDGLEPIYNQDGYAYVSLDSVQNLAVGDIVCLSNAANLFDLLNSKDYDVVANSLIGQIVGIYKNSNGTYQVKLQLPENMGDVFSKYDASMNLSIDTSAISSEELLKLESSVANQVTNDLTSSTELAEYLAAIGGSVNDYIAKYLADKGVSLKDAKDSEVLNFKFKIKPVKNGFVISVDINTKFPMKSDDGKDYGTINVTLTLENTVTVKLQNVGTKEKGFLYFNIRLVQENVSKTSFKVSYDYEYEADVKPFARKSDTGMIHCSTCRYVSYMKAPQYLDECPANAVYCSICKPQEHKTPSQFLEEELKDNLAHSDWGDLLNKVKNGKNNSNASLNKVIKSIVNKAGLTTSSANKKGMLLGSYTATAGVFTARFELWFVFDFNINASLNYEYESKTTKIYGIKNDSSGVGTYQKDGDDDYVSTDLRLMGSIDVSAGFRASADIGFLDFIALGVEGELGVYSEIAGVVAVTTKDGQGGSTGSGLGSIDDVFVDEADGYAALFYETGYYYSGRVYGRIGFLYINLLGGTRHDVPIYKLGYEKVYYSFAEPSDTITLDVNNSNPNNPYYINLANYSLDVKYLNLNSASNKDLAMSTQSGKLALDNSAKHYDVRFSIEQNDYCYLSAGGLQVYSSVMETIGIKAFTVKLTLNVIGTDNWKNYQKGYENSIYYLEEDYVITLNVTVHDWEETQHVEPNCCTKEYTRYDCRDCDAYYEKWGNFASNLHTAKKTVEAKAPTCYQVGWEAYEKCDDCGYSTYQGINPTGKHVFNSYIVVKEPTCTEYGREVQYCQTSGCNAKGYEHAIAPLEHKLVSSILTKATCTTPGIMADKCERCDHIENETVYDDPTGHQLRVISGQEPTCTKDGWYSYTVCDLCDYDTKLIRPALEHLIVEHDGKAATCTTIGYNDYQTCERCDYTTYKEIAPLKHILNSYDGLAPTCTETGYKAFVYCTRAECNYNTFDIIPALGHNMVVYDHCEPTCTAPGFTDTQCARCKIIEFGELVPAIGHLMEVKEAKEPTCIHFGWNEHLVCVRENCIYKEGYETIPKTGVHTWGDVLTERPTNTSIGWRYQNCTVCSERKNLAEIPKLPYSDGLIYQLTMDGKAYSVVGFEKEYLVDSVLRITPEYAGLAVTEISGSAIQNCDTITKVILPNSVTWIGSQAFSSCDALEEIQFGSQVIYIGSHALSNCYNLQEITLPLGINQIASTAFTNTGYYLNKDNWEDGVLYIGEYLIDGKNSNFGKVPTHLYIKEGTTHIAETAFYGSKVLEKITIPNTLTKIGYSAFGFCDNLKEVHVTDLDAWCRINFGNKESNPLYIAHNLYVDGKPVTSVTFADDITSINSYVFYACYTLEEIIIPQTVTQIGFDVFYDCQNLRELTIPFVGLSKEDIEWGNQLAYLFDGIYGTTVPSNLRKVTVTGNAPIWENAFSYCYSVTEIKILDKDVERIGFGAFADCYNLEKLTLPYVGEAREGTQNTHFGYVFGLQDYTEHVDLSESLNEVVITNASRVEAYSFYNCKHVESISINDTCTFIGDWAFDSCASITKITIGENVETIGNGAFSNMSSLAIIEYNAKNLVNCPVVENDNIGVSTFAVKQINDLVYIRPYEAFYHSGAENLKVIIGESVENIPNYLFYGLTVKEVYVQSVLIVEQLTSKGSQGMLIKNAETIGVMVDRKNVPEYIDLHYACMGTQDVDSAIYTIFTKHEHDFVNVSAKAPTCTEDGWEEYVGCSLCDYSRDKIEIIALGHKTEWIIEQQADCKSDGLKVHQCSVCEEILESEILPKLDHSYSEWSQLIPPTNQQDGIEYRVCVECGDTEKRVVDSLGTLLDTEINFGHSCSFHNNLTMNFYIPTEDLSKYDSFYLYVEQDVLVNGSWEVKSIELSGELTSSGYKFVFKGVAAAEAGNEFRAVLYAQLGNVQYKSIVDVYSIKDYAYSRLEKSTDSQFKTLLVDMLNYCSAAQIYFGVNTDNLVNADLTEEQKSLATVADSTVADTSSTVVLDGATAKIVGKSIVFNSNIEVKFYMDLSSYQDLTGIALRISYIDGLGKEIVTTINASEFEYDSSVGYYTAKIDTVNSAELRVELKVEVLLDEQVISDTVYYSVETYVYNRLNKSTDETFKVLLKVLMKYSDSAYRYFY